MKRISLFYLNIILLPIFVVFFNEYFVYYLAFLRCQWPAAERTKAMIIADTHLFGIYHGNWFDKLRREWQMYRSFQTAVSMFKPETIFFLGDLFDEGLLGRDEVFVSYVQRFNSLFETDKNVKKHVVMGNHDIGFHHEIFPQRLNRFTRYLRVPNAVEQVEIGGNIFVLLNSMAMEGDYCHLCAEAVGEVERLAQLLNCTRDFQSEKCTETLGLEYSRPILMQHFPLYRRSDMACDEAADAAPQTLREQKFKPKHDCISPESTRFLIEKLHPRAVFGGHTHYGCKKWWKAPDAFWEYTVPSFSWRNNHRSSFILAAISPTAISTSSCFVPDEYAVIAFYVVALCVWFGLIFKRLLLQKYTRRYRFKHLLKGNIE